MLLTPEKYRNPTSVTCCFCMNPRTGLLVLGVLGLISSGISFITTVARVIEISNSSVVMPTFVPVAMFLAILVSITISGLLIYGVKRNKSFFMFPWLSMVTLNLICLTIFAVCILFVPLSAGIIVLIFCFTLAALVLNGHYFYVGYFYYEHLRYNEFEKYREVPTKPTEFFPPAMV